MSGRDLGLMKKVARGELSVLTDAEIVSIQAYLIGEEGKAPPQLSVGSIQLRCRIGDRASTRHPGCSLYPLSSLTCWTFFRPGAAGAFARISLIIPCYSLFRGGQSDRRI